ncbi:MAG TPA: hypothetical protein VEB67_02930 [Nitrososphaerales archaeon]|nr:hypothetical protein [Nitrososphaerales archaeon]
MSSLGGAVAVAFLAVLMVGPVAVAAQPGTGFVDYKVTASTMMGGHSLNVNETVKTTDRAGFSDVVLQLIGSTQNLTYSRLVNSTTELFPYLPTIPSQQFDYSNTTYSIHANFTQSGTKEIAFQGANYTLTVYSISLVATYGNRTVAAAGDIEAFPSSLVYSVSLVSGPLASVSVILQGTNLQLTQSSPQMGTAAYVGAGVGVVGIAGAAALFVRRRDRHSRTQEQKPMHWVD